MSLRILQRHHPIHSTAIVLLLAVSAIHCGQETPPPDPPEVAALGRLQSTVKSQLDQATEKVRSNPKDWSGWAALGMVYEIHDAPAPALECYAVAADHLPKDAQWPYRAAIVAGKTGALDLALQWIDRSLALDPNYGTSHYRKGNWLLELGRLEEAKHSYQRAAELDPNKMENWGGLARVALQSDAPEEALELVKKARKLSPSDPYLHLLHGITLAQLGRDAEAEPHLALGQGSAPSVNDPRSRTVSQARTKEQDLYTKGIALEEKGDWNGAIRAYREIMQDRPDEIRLPLRLARTLVNANRMEEALQLTKETLAKYPNHLDLLVFYGALLTKLGDQKGAWEACNRAIAANPDRADGYTLQSSLFTMEGKHQKALEAAQKAVDRNPADSGGYETLAVRYATLQQPWDSVRVLESALNLEGLKPSKHLYEMLIQGLKAIQRADKLPPVIQRAQNDYGTQAFPNQ